MAAQWRHCLAAWRQWRHGGNKAALLAALHCTGGIVAAQWGYWRHSGGTGGIGAALAMQQIIHHILQHDVHHLQILRGGKA